VPVAPRPRIDGTHLSLSLAIVRAHSMALRVLQQLFGLLYVVVARFCSSDTMMVYQGRIHLSARLAVLILGIRLRLLLRSIVVIRHWRHLSSFCVVLGGGTVLQTLCFSSEDTVCVRGTIQHNTWLVVPLPSVFFVWVFFWSAHLVAALEFTGVRILVMI
jgi:hypothetical protein